MNRKIASIVLIGALSAGVTACTPSMPQPSETDMNDRTAAKQGDGTLRTDLAPIAKRYPQLASAESIAWMGGMTGTSDIGPSTYWVDVVAVLPPSEIAALQAHGALETVDPPQLVSGMQSRLPSGPFEGSAALDDLFSSDGHDAKVALDARARTIVLSGLFE